MPKKIEITETEHQPMKIDLAAAVDAAMRGMHALREDNAALGEEVNRLEMENISLSSQVETLKIQLEAEKAERRHYHSLANEIITRLDIVGRTVDDVVKRAEQEVYRQRRESPKAEVPELEKMPERLQAFINGSTQPTTEQREAA